MNGAYVTYTPFMPYLHKAVCPQRYIDGDIHRCRVYACMTCMHCMHTYVKVRTTVWLCICGRRSEQGRICWHECCSCSSLLFLQSQWLVLSLCTGGVVCQAWEETRCQWCNGYVDHWVWWMLEWREGILCDPFGHNLSCCSFDSRFWSTPTSSKFWLQAFIRLLWYFLCK